MYAPLRCGEGVFQLNFTTNKFQNVVLEMELILCSGDPIQVSEHSSDDNVQAMGGNHVTFKFPNITTARISWNFQRNSEQLLSFLFKEQLVPAI